MDGSAYANLKMRDASDTTTFITANNNEVGKTRDECFWFTKFTMVVVIFFSFGCVAGLYGPRLFTDPEHLNGMGRSENFAKEFESGHEHLKVNDFENDFCLNHADQHWLPQGTAITNVKLVDIKSLYGAQATGINSLEVHPRWNRTTFHFDFALIMTQKKLKYKYGTHATRPICLPKIGSDLRILKTIQSEGFLNCKLAGWGVTDADGFRASPVLKQVVLPWINNEECNKIWDSDPATRWIDIEEFMLCFGQTKGGVDACRGDSGGSISCVVDDIPLSMGVVSWGIGCAEPNRPGVYARTSIGAVWAMKRMKEMDNLEENFGYSIPEHWFMRARCLQNIPKSYDNCTAVKTPKFTVIKSPAEKKVDKILIDRVLAVTFFVFLVILFIVISSNIRREL